ncbi:hypothetical protein OS493_010880 [Desmophyllum pertusum]|uniref:Sacsin/Nov domain-containing protein n=1 Tax=Desmophyllum pertusum TaxID=174260 RepID=A0A9W9ZHJ8_9CNID|nr:hypothetical protein OS493_010880 [Desmophyllum pertusum]
MFRETTKLKGMFPDVFSCYIEDEFPIRNATMFRFPLRTQKMANDSKISNSPVTLEALDDMMEALKKELFEVLLFVNSVTKITLCDIDPITGKTVNHYFVESQMSEEDATKRQQFATYLKQIGKAAEKRDDSYLSNIEVKTCQYDLNLRDSLGNEEKWLIVQQVGFGDEVKTSVVDAYKRHDLGMLPRGGVACLLENKSTTRECDNFVLSYTFGRGEAFYNLPITRNAEPVTLNCRKDALVKVIDDYEKLFPFGVFDNPYWETLVRSVYQGMDKKRLRLLPVVRSGASEGTSPNKVQLTWLPPTGEGKSKAFFNNIERVIVLPVNRDVPRVFLIEARLTKRRNEESSGKHPLRKFYCKRDLTL